jgi:hypothetical protein
MRGTRRVLLRPVFTRWVTVSILLLAGCVVGEASSPTGDDDDVPQDPGPEPGPGSNPSSMPTLAVTADKPAIATELSSSNSVTLTLRSSGGFSGTATLVATALDLGGAPITGWTVTLDKTTIDLAADATATAVATLKIPSSINTLTGVVKIDATTSLGTVTAQSSVSVTKQITYAMTLSGGNCVYPVAAGSSTTISQGTKVRWINNDPANRIIIHMSAVGGQGISGFDHEPDPGMAPNGGAFEQTAGSATGAIDWYCHNRGASQGITLRAAP